MTAGKHGTERREVLSQSPVSPNVKRNLPFGWNWVSNVFSSSRKGTRRCLILRPTAARGRRRLPARRPCGGQTQQAVLLECHSHTALAVRLGFWRPRLFVRSTGYMLLHTFALSSPYAALPPPSTCMSARHACDLQAFQPPHLFEFPAGRTDRGLGLWSCYPPTQNVINSIARRALQCVRGILGILHLYSSHMQTNYT